MNEEIINRNNETYVPLYLLRRLGHRAERVVVRHADKHTVLEAMKEPLMALVIPYNALYDELQVDDPWITAEVNQGRTAIKRLRREHNAWASAMQGDVEGFERSKFVVNRDVAEEVLAKAERLLEVAQRHKETAEQPVAYIDQLLESLGAVLEDATKEWAEAQAALAARQEKQAEVRKLAALLHQKLVSLRQVLRAVLGTSHRDFQKLRMAKATTLDEEDEEVESGDAEAGAPAPTPADAPAPTLDEDDEQAAE